MTTMRAAVLAAPGRIEIADVPVPEPAPGEVRVRLQGCGVCASNLEPWAGLEWLTYPGAPGGLGHEGWGTVDAVGEGVAGLAAGDRVATLGTHSFAEYETMPAAAAIPLPTGIDGDFPGEALGCAMNIWHRSEVTAESTVAIIGIGFLGAILTRLAAAAGARVIAISRRQESLDLAHRFGAAEVVPMHDHWEIINSVKMLTNDALCPRVIEAVGKQWPLDLATALVAPGGRLIIAGYHQDGPRQVNMQDWNWKGIDVINAHERNQSVRRRGVEEAAAAVADGTLDDGTLYTHRYPLERLGEALDATRDKPGGFVKALIEL